MVYKQYRRIYNATRRLRSSRYLCYLPNLACFVDLVLPQANFVRADYFAPHALNSLLMLVDVALKRNRLVMLVLPL